MSSIKEVLECVDRQKWHALRSLPRDTRRTIAESFEVVEFIWNYIHEEGRDTPIDIIDIIDSIRIKHLQDPNQL